MKHLKFLFVLFFMTSCGSTVHYDYEKSTNFNNYKSYNYFDNMKTGLSELDTKRLIRAMDAKLKNMGLSKSENPEFFIDIQSQDIHSRNNSNVGIGVGGGGGRVGGGVSIGIPVGQRNNNREIMIDFVDKSNGERLFWQAIAESSYNPNATPEIRAAQFEKIVEKVFSKYPPEQ
ncbi:DUF4136 domain-containing protein [Winogradskyella bathintestinalis]|uniref:DUF4136 domain-containing protein n=1 Tax=Winogradskyella bathintestinalis TaxID=3035208 RepID=A0ABT7ZY62_9FLAO|nr:DUF4136 domain-containing protein [Winogradskyella bathintestinalis]MDN3493952.1 DUF4136 domain-containing protein [Winogradskyella bathintestinalis]